MKRFLSLLICFLIPLILFSQEVPVTEFMQFNGRYDFTAFGNTLNTAENGSAAPCTILTESSADFNLDPNQTLVSAHLYWSGSGTGVFDVKLNGIDISADRTFNLFVGRTGLDYFAAYADVTNIVQATGNGTYTFSDMDLNSVIGPYCGGGTNYGGWSIIVIYEEPGLLLNQITLFDGLQYVDSGRNVLDITLGNISAATDVAAKVGFLAWEGDSAIAVNETLTLNGVLISNPPLNPPNNAFNSTNSYTNSAELWNMDLDYYNLEGLNIIEPGDDHIDIRLTSGQDFIMVNNVIVSVNSELPDATITIDQLGVLCEDSTMDVHYTVHNINSTAPLPPNTPIAFYIDDNLVAQAQTLTEIPIEGSESGTIELTIPPGTPQVFTLKAVVDDDGIGNGVVLEINEDNNEDEIQVDLSQQGLQVVGPEQVCEGDEITLEANFTDLDVYEWFFNGNPYGGNTSSITVTQPGIYAVQGTRASCYVASPDFEIFFNPVPLIAAPPEDLFRCDNGIETGIFNLTQNTPIVMGTQDPTVYGVKYFESLNDAQNNINDIINPVAYQIIPPTPQTIYVRIYNRIQEDCYDLASFELYYTFVEGGDVEPYVICDQDDDGGEELDLPALFDQMVLNGLAESEFNITYHLTQGEAESRTNALPDLYTVPTPGQTLHIRIEPVIYTDCYDLTTVEITVDSPPAVNPDPSPLVVCDLDNDGYASFFLHDADGDISLGDPTLIITYHGTLENAQLNVDELPEPYVNDDPWSDVVYARIEDPDMDCYATSVLPLEVRLTPDLADPTPLVLCEDAPGSGTAVFDLTSRESEMLDGSDPTDYDFYYYEDQSEAVIAGDLALTAPDFSAAIGSPTTYTNIANPQTVYVLAVGSTTFTAPFNGGEGCYDIVELELIVKDLPVPVQPAPYELCDDVESGSNTDQRSYFNLTSRNGEITDGDTTLTVTWFETFADEANDIPIADPTAYLNTTTPQTVVARVTNVAGCDFLVTLTLVVNPVPDAAAPTPLVACGGSNGYAQFTLTDKDDEIANGNPGLVISYHGTLDDAQLNRNILSIPHTNTTPWNDVVYARVVDGVTGCLVVVELPLEVRVSPNLATPSPLILCEDAQGSGTAVFDLTSKEAEMLDGTDPAHVDFYYYEDQADAVIAGDLALTNPNYSDAIVNPGAYTNTANPQIVYVLAVGTGDFTAPHNGGEGCYDIVELELIVKEEPVAVQPAPYELCDDVESGSNTDQRSYFDLTSRNSEITGGNTTLTVTWFETFADEANDTPIADPTAYLNTTTPQTVVARVGNAAGCRTLVTLTLIVNPVPDAAAPTPLIACDGGTSGYAQFYLTDKDDEIANGNPGLAISYHGTLDDAQNIRNILAIPYTNTTPWNDVVYARVVDGVTGCLVIVELPLEVRLSPNLTTPTPLVYCEAVQGSGTAVFDLTSKEAEMLDGTDPTHIDFYYYEDQSDAIIAGDLALTNPNYSAAIVNPGAYTNIANPQTVYVLAVGTGDFTTPPNGGEGCYDIVELELIVEEEPVAVQPEPYELCDDVESGSNTDQQSYFDLTSRNAEVTGGNTTLAVTWFETFADEAADNPIADPTAYLNTATPQTVAARVSSAADCRTLVTLTLIVNPVPDAADPTPLIACDGGSDGYAQFTLTDKDDEIANGNPGLTITYHGTLEDAQNNQNILAIPYTNTTPWNDIVYARVVDGVTGCLVIVELPLEVRLSPNLTTPTPLVYCEAVQGSGTAVFDLTSKEAEMLDGTDPTHIDFYYYEDQADAIIAGDLALTNPNYSAAIVSPAAYTNIANPQTVYVLAVGTGDFTTPPNGGEGCYDIVELELIVEEEPVPVQPAPYELCDDLESGSDTDQTSYFDLTSRNAEITDGDTTLTVTWFETFADEANDTPIADPTAYLNTATPQTVVARVSSAADCRALVTLTLIVNPVPNAIAPTPLVVCDADNEGYAYFMLTDKDEEISGGNPDILVSYHETEIDALNGVFPLASPFQNIVAGGQTVYARAFFADPPAGTGCFTVVPLELIVSPTPEMPVELPDLVECDIDGNEQAVFDLTQQDELIYGGQDPTLFDLTYHRTQAEAEQGIGAIASPEAFTDETNPQDIYARLGFIAGDGCYAIGKFTLIVAPAVPINDPDPLELCTPLGEPNTGTAIFDLTIKDTEITGGVAGLGVRYYLTEEDAQSNENWIVPATAFENTENPQRIYVRVIDTNSECAAFTSLLLRVLPNPEPVTPAPIELCDADNSGTAEFDLTIREAEILNGEDWVISYFETYNDAVADENAIADPEQYENIENPQIIYVRVTNEVSGCFEIVELELIVRPIADVNNEITPYLICEINTTGVATFDLTTKIPEILGDLPPEDYLVTFYLSQVDEIGR